MSSDRELSMRWIDTHKYATFMIAGYVFAILSFVPLFLTDKQGGMGSIFVVPFLAVIYLIPFLAAAICWSLWKRIAKTSLTVRQENLCLMGIWLLVMPIFADMMLYLPLEQVNAVQQHFTIRVLAPLFDGIVFSPVATLLGALAGTGAYRISIRWGSRRPTVQVLLTIVVASLEFIGLVAVNVFTGLAGVMVALAALALAILGKSIKDYQNRQERTWVESTTTKVGMLTHHHMSPYRRSCLLGFHSRISLSASPICLAVMRRATNPKFVFASW